ncbi:sarcoplasmic calcium-binding protein-like [Lingula anatina]|uniref:Sarcoplasmic calcium-binding protein-like n=1 Tax=Lingula anatina TaxID=7574 RepID=A0A1S3IWS0_LINAN|nr:sarcoplasmic calcium-binding protein-like [Lingula anatina]|eukprot:XP_013402416.1 sarcoplasmic calcium-binding protein-like [Lingula anatina]
MSRIIIPMRGIVRRQPAERRLATVFQPARTFGKVIWNTRTWITRTGFGLGSPRFSQPARGVVNRPLRLKKMPTDYPLLTGSEHWRRKIRTVFQRMDANADGYMTKKDFVVTAQALIDYLGLTGERAECIFNKRIRVWEEIAGDKTRITVDEYCQDLLSYFNDRHFREESYHTLICTEFNAIDIDGDGFIFKKDHDAYYYSLNIPTEYSKDVFDVMDTNRDGLVSIDEFAEGFLEFWMTEDPNNIYNQKYGPLAD